MPSSSAAVVEDVSILLTVRAGSATIGRKIAGHQYIEVAFCSSTGARQSDQVAAAAPARLEALFLPWAARGPRGQYALARALPNNPYDGHILRDVIEETQRLTAARSSGPMSTRDTAVLDTENPRRVFISGQKRACSAPSSANCGVDPTSSQSPAT
jgi:hypothetical protein